MSVIFRYEWFERLLKSNGVEIIVVNNKNIDRTRID